MLFRPRAVSIHIVVVGCAGIFHLVDRLLHVAMGLVQIVPVTNPLGNQEKLDF